MTTIINGSSPSITFSDSTTQASAGLTAASPTITSGVLTFPDASTQGAASKVLQVVTGTLGTVFSTTSSSYVSTGLSATITPKFSTSKIFFIVNAQAYAAASAQPVVTVYRNGSNLNSGGFTVAYVNNQAFQASLSCNYLDSPASTSAQTYTVYVGNANGSQQINFNGNAYSGYPIASITLMEIAA